MREVSLQTLKRVKALHEHARSGLKWSYISTVDPFSSWRKDKLP